MASYRIVIDPTLSGFGSCVESAPGAFQLDRRGIAVASGRSSDPTVVEAAASCPMGAITIIDETADLQAA